jgi:hypothetical protein
MEIRVTKEDIKAARNRRSSGLTGCAVARAFRRAGFRGIEVGFSMAWNTSGEIVHLPRRIEDFIGQVMNDKSPVPKPISFSLNKKQIAVLQA